MRHDADEPAEDEIRHAKRLLAREGRRQPGSIPSMLGCGLAEGVDVDVDVREDQR
jgi:hypothetical protein